MSEPSVPQEWIDDALKCGRVSGTLRPSDLASLPTVKDALDGSARRAEQSDALAKLMDEPVPEWAHARVRFAKCPHCKKRPTFRARPGADVEMGTGVGDERVTVPWWEIIPCCSARHVKTNDRPTRLDMIRAKAAHDKGKR